MYNQSLVKDIYKREINWTHTSEWEISSNVADADKYLKMTTAGKSLFTYVKQWLWGQLNMCWMTKKMKLSKQPAQPNQIVE